MKIAFISLASWGDCVNSTFMIGALKENWPDATIDLYSTGLCASAFDNHPDINNRTIIPATNKSHAFEAYRIFAPQLRTNFIADPNSHCLAGKNYDLHVMPCPFYQPDWWESKQHPELGRNIICCFMRNLEEMGIPYRFPLDTRLHLRPQEIDRARGFISKVKGRRILMEVEGESGQTFWDDNWTLRVGRFLMSDQNRSLIVSRRQITPAIRQLISEKPSRVWFAGGMSLRECVEIYNNCHAFLSVSSGLSCACNTHAARRDMPWIEVTQDGVCTSAPLRQDGKVFWHTNDIDSYIKALDEVGV